MKAIACVVATFLLVLLPVRYVAAQVNEATLVQAMQQLGQTWQSLSDTGEVLVIQCPGNTYKGVRVGTHATVSVDLQRTTSVMNPYVGIVRIRGRSQINSSQQNGACHGSVAEAQQSTAWWGNDQDYDLEAYYHFQGGTLDLVNGNEVFRNQFINQPGPPILAAGSLWAKALHYPVGVAGTP